MTSFFKKTALICCTAVMLLCCGCGNGKAEETVVTEPPVITLPPAPTEEETVPQTDPKEEIEHLTVVMQAGEIYTLDQYPNLKSVDLSGSTCYDTILNYIEKHPDVAVTYTVSFGGTQISHKESQITLSRGSFDAALLLENLQYLPELTTVTLQDVDLTAEQVAQLGERYPEITLNYTVEILGQSYDVAVEELDLSAMGSGQVDAVLSRLGLLTNLNLVTLSDSLSFADVVPLLSIFCFY